MGGQSRNRLRRGYCTGKPSDQVLHYNHNGISGSYIVADISTELEKPSDLHRTFPRHDDGNRRRRQNMAYQAGQEPGSMELWPDLVCTMRRTP